MLQERENWLIYAVDDFKERVADILPHMDLSELALVIDPVVQFLLEEHERDLANEQSKINLANEEEDGDANI